MDVKKTLKVGGIIVVSAIAAAFIGIQIRLWLIYKKVSTVDEASALLDSPMPVALTLPDPSLSADMAAAAAADDDGSTTIGTGDDLDAVIINGDTYTGDSNTQIYNDTQGNQYDGNADTITYVNGDVQSIDPSTVEYGTLDSSGDFVQDTSN